MSNLRATYFYQGEGSTVREVLSASSTKLHPEATRLYWDATKSRIVFVSCWGYEVGFIQVFPQNGEN